MVAEPDLKSGAHKERMGSSPILDTLRLFTANKISKGKSSVLTDL